MNRHDPQNNQTVANYDSFAWTFAKSRAGMHWPEFDALTSELQAFSSSKEIRILDVWCGSWRLLEALSNGELPVEYLGIDESSLMIEEARKAHPGKEFMVLPMQNIDTLNDNFDMLVFLASFHHLQTEAERITVLRKAKDVLSSSGKIFMTNWNLSSDTNRKKYAPSLSGGQDYDVKFGKATRFYHAFQPDELSSLFEEAGFRNVKHDVNERNIVTVASA